MKTGTYLVLLSLWGGWLLIFGVEFGLWSRVRLTHFANGQERSRVGPAGVAEMMSGRVQQQGPEGKQARSNGGLGKGKKDKNIRKFYTTNTIIFPSLSQTTQIMICNQIITVVSLFVSIKYYLCQNTWRKINTNK